MALTAPHPTQLRPFTYEDYAALPDDGNRYEVIGGELVMSPAPNPKHQRATGRLYRRFADFVEVSGTGEAFVSPIDVWLSPHNVVQPDIAVVLKERAGIVGDAAIVGAPDIVVEVLSPSNRAHDLVRKAALYADHGVPECWFLDPESETVAVNRLSEGQYVPVPLDDGLARSLVLPGFAVNPSELFIAPAWMTVGSGDPTD